MKVALAYDRVNKWGGAERVLLALHELFPQAPLFTSVYNPERAQWANVFKVIPSFLQSFPSAKSAHELYATLMPLAFESFRFDSYDVVISVTSEAAKGIITLPGTKHICYCLTPTRYLWSGYDDYFKNGLFKSLSQPALSYLRRWEKVAAKRPDMYVAISQEVRKRIKMYYDQDAEVIYPPVDLPGVTNQTRGSRGAYYLVVSRLVTYKRIELAIKACNRLKEPLVIVGEGHDKNRLQSIAGPTITFRSNLTDQELVEYYKGCKALVFPGVEDFGIAVVEAQRFGKPVIAYKGGGALETVIDGKTGMFFTPQTESALVRALQTFSGKKIDAQACKRQADMFTKEKFKKQFLTIMEKIL